MNIWLTVVDWLLILCVAGLLYCVVWVADKLINGGRGE